MSVLIAQAVAVAVVAMFGVLALACGFRTPESRGGRRDAWLLTGTAFLTAGGIGVLHSIWAAHAFFAGPGSIAWTEYLRWAPAGNQSRGMLVVVFSLILALLAIKPARSGRWLWRAVAFGFPLALIGGGAMGWMEGPFVDGGHYLRLAASNLVQQSTLAIALLLHLSRDTMDRLLWASLTIYWLRLGVGTLWTAASTAFGAPEVLLPSALDHALIAIGCHVGMLLFGLRYLAHQRRDRYVPAVLEHARSERVRSTS